MGSQLGHLMIIKQCPNSVLHDCLHPMNWSRDQHPGQNDSWNFHVRHGDSKTGRYGLSRCIQITSMLSRIEDVTVSKSQNSPSLLHSLICPGTIHVHTMLTWNPLSPWHIRIKLQKNNQFTTSMLPGTIYVFPGQGNNAWFILVEHIPSVSILEPFADWSDGPSVSHNPYNTPFSCDLYKLLVPTEEYTHCLSAPLTAAPWVYLREPAGLGRRRTNRSRGWLGIVWHAFVSANQMKGNPASQQGNLNYRILGKRCRTKERSVKRNSPWGRRSLQIFHENVQGFRPAFRFVNPTKHWRHVGLLDRL